MGVGFQRLLLALGCAILLVSSACRPAAASPVTYDVIFGAADFSLFSGSGTPAGIVGGRFHITLDPLVGSDGTAGLSLDFLSNITLGSTLTYGYDAGSDVLFIGGDAGGLNGLLGNDLQLVIQGLASSTPSFYSMDYSLPSGAQFSTTTGFVNVTQVAATPIPAALPLFVSALGGLGYLGWRRRKAAA